MTRVASMACLLVFVACGAQPETRTIAPLPLMTPPPPRPAPSVPSKETLPTEAEIPSLSLIPRQRTEVFVSSELGTEECGAEHIVQPRSDPERKWCTEAGDVVGAWIVLRVAPDAIVRRVGLELDAPGEEHTFVVQRESDPPRKWTVRSSGGIQWFELGTRGGMITLRLESTSLPPSGSLSVRRVGMEGIVGRDGPDHSPRVHVGAPADVDGFEAEEIFRREPLLAPSVASTEPRDAPLPKASGWKIARREIRDAIGTYDEVGLANAAGRFRFGVFRRGIPGTTHADRAIVEAASVQAPYITIVIRSPDGLVAERRCRVFGERLRCGLRKPAAPAPTVP